MISSDLLLLALVVLVLMLFAIRLFRGGPTKNNKLPRLRHKLNRLQLNDPHKYSLGKVILLASPSERETLKLLVSKESTRPRDIAKSIRVLGSHDIARFARWIRGKETNVSYDEILEDVSKSCNLSSEGKKTADLEKNIIESIFKSTYSKLTKDEKIAIDDFIKQESNKYTQKLKGVGVAAGSMLAMKVSGFGVYLMASTLVGGITHALGTTLPFAFYTGMSSSISVILGPVGWSLLAAWGLYKIGSPNRKKTVQSVIIVGCIRQRLINSWEVQLAELRKQIADLEAELVNKYQ